MMIKETDGAFEKIVEVYPDDLELLVSAANIAGYMEHAEKLSIESDGELSVFSARLVQAYYREGDIGVTFPEFAEARLWQQFGIED